MSTKTSSRPKVEIRTTDEKGDWPGAKQAVAWCHTIVDVVRGNDTHAEACTFLYVASVKVDAEEKARWHRDWHRSNPGVLWQQRTHG